VENLTKHRLERRSRLAKAIEDQKNAMTLILPDQGFYEALEDAISDTKFCDYFPVSELATLVFHGWMGEFFSGDTSIMFEIAESMVQSVGDELNADDAQELTDVMFKALETLYDSMDTVVNATFQPAARVLSSELISYCGVSDVKPKQIELYIEF